MLIDTRKTIHMGVNFVMTPMPPINATLRLEVQRFLEEAGVPISIVNQTERELIVGRQKPNPLEIKVALMQPPIGQLLIIAPFPERDLAAFIEEAEIAVEAFESLSPPYQRQLLTKDVTLRDLYDTGGTHAFQEIWETVLKQQAEALRVLKKPVRGGGLRFVIPPLASESDPAHIELKIESYLKDTAKLFVEAQFTWPQSSPPGTKLSPRTLLSQVEEYITQTVWAFMGVAR